MPSLLDTKIIPALKDFAAEEKRPNLIDTRNEKNHAMKYLLEEWNHVPLGSEEVQYFKQATDVLLKDNFAVVEKNAASKRLLLTVSYLGNVIDTATAIAASDGAPHMIDTENEKKQLTKYLADDKTRKHLLTCELKTYNSVFKILKNKSGLQIWPFFYFPIEKSGSCNGSSFSAIAAALGLSDDNIKTYLAPLPDNIYVEYTTSSVDKSKCSDHHTFGMKETGICTSVLKTDIDLNKETWEAFLTPLKSAISAEEERIALINVVESLPGFPSNEDCTHQSYFVSNVLWLISASGYLKWHTFDASYGRVFLSDVMRHFSSGVVEKGTETFWMIDTWGAKKTGYTKSGVLPLSEWLKTDFPSDMGDMTSF